MDQQKENENTQSVDDLQHSENQERERSDSATKPPRRELLKAMFRRAKNLRQKCGPHIALIRVKRIGVREQWWLICLRKVVIKTWIENGNKIKYTKILEYNVSPIAVIRSHYSFNPLYSVFSWIRNAIQEIVSIQLSKEQTLLWIFIVNIIRYFRRFVINQSENVESSAYSSEESILVAIYETLLRIIEVVLNTISLIINSLHSLADDIHLNLPANSDVIVALIQLL